MEMGRGRNGFDISPWGSILNTLRNSVIVFDYDISGRRHQEFKEVKIEFFKNSSMQYKPVMN